MRADMHKVFTRQQHRRGKGWRKLERKGEARQLASTPLEELPFFEARTSHKGFRARRMAYGVLRKWFASRTGRLWSDVFSEFCEHNDLRSPAQRELRTRVFVEEKVVLVEGVPYDSKRRYRVHEPWVHPQTGILMPSPPPSWRRSRVKSKKERQREKAKAHSQFGRPQHVIDRNHRLVRINGYPGSYYGEEQPAWYIVTLRPIPEAEPDDYEHWPHDILSSSGCGDWQWFRHWQKREWGDYVYAVEMRRASNKVIRRVTSAKKKKRQTDNRAVLRMPA